MKNNIIQLLKDEKQTQIEKYNALLQFLSTKRGLFSIRNFQSGYSESKFESLVYEVKKDFEISDMDIHTFVPGEEVPADENPDDLTPEEIEAAKVAHQLEADKRNIDPKVTAFLADLDKNEEAKEGLKFHEEYPFLDDENTPMEIKALVTDKFAAWRNLAKNHAALVEGLEENEAQEKIYELAKGAVDNFQLNGDIKKELDFYKDQGKVLGKHPSLNNLKIEQEINELKDSGELVEMKNKAQKNASKARVEIENKGTNEGREKRVTDWTLRETLATKRLDTEFKKK